MQSEVSSAAPIDKVAYSAYAGAIVAIATWVLKDYAKVEIPPQVASAVTMLVGGAIGYITPLRSGEVRNKV